MTTVILMVGVSGSGKSTYARSLAGAFVVSADDHFEVDGQYRFNPAELGVAHGKCLRRFIEALSAKSPPALVVVDNTNTSIIELAPYVAVAQAYDCEIEIVRIVCPPEVAAARNTHGVPEAAVRAMHERIETMFQNKFPPFWRVLTTHRHPNQAGVSVPDSQSAPVPWTSGGGK